MPQKTAKSVEERRQIMRTLYRATSDGARLRTESALGKAIRRSQRGALQHSQEFVGAVIEYVTANRKVSLGRKLLEMDPRLTSTPLGYLAQDIAEDILADEKFAKSFIDVEICEDNIFVNFDKTAASGIKDILEGLGGNGKAELLASPGDPIFPGTISDYFIISVEPTTETMENYVAQPEANSPAVEEDDTVEDVDDGYNDLTQCEELGLEPELFSDEALEECPLTLEDVEELYSEFFGADQLEEGKKNRWNRLKLAGKATKAAKGKGINKVKMRNWMLRAMAQKGYLVHGKIKKSGVTSKIKAWKKFKAKVTGAKGKKLMKVAKESSADDQAFFNDLTEEYGEDFVSDLVLNESDIEISEADFDAAIDELVNDSEEEGVSLTDVAELYAAEMLDTTDPLFEFKKGRLWKRAQKAQKGGRGKAKDVMARMYRAMAQKGVLVGGKYKKSGVSGKIAMWKKFVHKKLRVLKKKKGKQQAMAAKKFYGGKGSPGGTLPALRPFESQEATSKMNELFSDSDKE